MLAHEVMERCRALAGFSEDSGSICRTFLSPPVRQVYQEVGRWLSLLGAESNIDAAGNFHALYSGTKPDSPRLLIGSHLDTVPNAGAYDGVLGVVLAIALIRALNGRKLPFAIEVVAFCEEEGVRFGIPFIGSRALVGRLGDDVLDRQDAQGISVRKAITDFALNPAEIPQAAIHANTLGYLEFHIEQGPVLEKLGFPLGVVEAIAGQSRLEFIFEGRANHAGTTPMSLRYDAVAASAEWILTVEQLAQNTLGLVATVGSIQAKPGVGNVIAREARVSLDVRHRDDATRTGAVDDLVRKAGDIARRRGLSVRWNLLLDQKAVAMDPFLVNQITDASQRVGCQPQRMVSGAGHDAMIMAEKVPAAMIFLRTPGGISHDPAESVQVEDVAKAIECGVELLAQLASSTEFLARTQRA